MRRIYTYKLVINLFLSILVIQAGLAQTTIFSENLGTPSATTTIVNYSSGVAPATFQNIGTLTYSNGGAANPADIRISNVSSGYTGASGNGNVFFTSSSGTYGFSIESINASNYTSLSLQYAYRKESTTGLASFSVEYWDGTAWVVVANSATNLFNEAATAGTGWYLAKTLSLPAAAQISGLKIRFVKSGSLSIRIDDVKLTGTSTIQTPTTTSISPTSAYAGSAGFTITVNGTNFVSGASTVTWNGVARTTTFVNSTQLTATIPSSDIINSGTANVGVTTTGAVSVSNTQSFTINPAVSPTIILNSALADFGSICINTTSSSGSFNIDGVNLDGSNIAVAPLTGFTYSETLAGTYTSTLSFSYTGSSFTGKTIYVQFNPTAIQSYNGTINLSGGGLASNFQVAVTASGVFTGPTVTTNTATGITATSGTANGSINSPGCSAVTNYGIEYSTTSGFPNGSGTPINGSNLSGGNFSVILTGVTPNARYYYHAFATNSGTTNYGAQQAFNANPLPVVMAQQPNLTFIETFSDIVNWDNFFINGTGSNHWDGLSATATSPAAGIPNPTILTTQTNTFQLPSGTPPTPSTSGGVQKGTDQTVSLQNIVLLSTGSTASLGGVTVNNNFSSAAIDLYVDFTGVNANTLSFDYAEINNGTAADNRPGSLRVYYSVDGTSFSELTNVLNFSNNVALSGSKSNIPLPAELNNAPNAFFRFYYYNGETGGTTGSRPKLSIDNVKITAVANVPCSPPSAPATNLVFGTITDVSIAGSFTPSVPAADGYIVVVSTNSSLTANPKDQQIYNVGDNLGDGTVISSGSATTFTATGLNALSTYYFFVFPMNNICTGGPLYFTSSILSGSAATVAGLPNCTAPATQPTNLSFGTTSINSIQGTFTATTADNYLVVSSTSSSLSLNPVDGHVYTAGEALGNGTVIQSGTATNFTASGLLPNTQYFFFVFASNSNSCVNGPAYNSNSPLTNSQTTMPLPACATPLVQPSTLALTASSNSISGTFSAGTGADNYLVVQSTSPSLSAMPVDNTDYIAGDGLGGGVVIANTPNTSFLSANLSPNTLYYYFVFAVNKNCSGGTKYLATNPLTGNKVTLNVVANNIYFGTLHSHSDYSDGNKDNPGYKPSDDYNYAMTAQCMDYLGISEHNHFSSLDNPGNIISNYHLGVTQANDFTSANPKFLALYGMEWGVISGGGHVVIYGNGMDNLWGWESGSGGWGTTNNYDVYVPKSTYTGSTGLFKTVNDNIATNTFATLAHPNLTDFNNLAGVAYDAVADAAITGVAVESGPATSTNTTYSNPGSSMSYLYYYQTMLSKGYHLGPTIDHDNHNTTFGHTTYSRTAIIAPSLTKAAIINAMRNMNFYASQDCSSKVDFNINTKIMGSVFTDRFAPNISVTLTPSTNGPLPAGANATTAIIRLMFGVPGSGVLPVKIDSVIGNSLNFTDNNLANLSTGYYYLDITSGTSTIITSPIWYTRNDLATVLPIKLGTFTVTKVDNRAKINWVTEQEINTANFEIERSGDGKTWFSILNIPAAGNSSQKINYTDYDNAPLNGYNYYRLKLINKDGSFEYSSVQKLLFSSKNYASVFPNPTSDFINVYFDKPANNVSEVQLISSEGKTVFKTKTQQNLLKIDAKNLASGVYFVKIIDNENLTTISKVVLK